MNILDPITVDKNGLPAIRPWFFCLTAILMAIGGFLMGMEK